QTLAIPLFLPCPHKKDRKYGILSLSPVDFQASSSIARIALAVRTQCGHGRYRMSKLNEEIVKSLPVPETGNKVHYFPDAVLQGAQEPRGFGVRITAGGVRSFVMNYRAAHRERRYTIGQWPDWSVLRAVKVARDLRQRVDRGEDPLDDRRKQKSAGENTFKA